MPGSENNQVWVPARATGSTCPPPSLSRKGFLDLCVSQGPRASGSGPAGPTRGLAGFLEFHNHPLSETRTQRKGTARVGVGVPSQRSLPGRQVQRAVPAPGRSEGGWAASWQGVCRGQDRAGPPPAGSSRPSAPRRPTYKGAQPAESAPPRSAGHRSAAPQRPGECARCGRERRAGVPRLAVSPEDWPSGAPGGHQEVPLASRLGSGLRQIRGAAQRPHPAGASGAFSGPQGWWRRHHPSRLDSASVSPDG